jgi:hypothetical protein
MNSGAFWELGGVTDRDLQAELTLLLASGSRTEARIIAHLAAVEERRLHLEAGSSSLFDYCIHRLGLSESEAFHRITAARLARRFPVIFGLIERRAVHLSAVCLLRDYLTPENHRELLDEARGKLSSKFRSCLPVAFRGQMSPRPSGSYRRRVCLCRCLLLHWRYRARPRHPKSVLRMIRRRMCHHQHRASRRTDQWSSHSQRRAIGFSSTPPRS